MDIVLAQKPVLMMLSQEQISLISNLVKSLNFQMEKLNTSAIQMISNIVYVPWNIFIFLVRIVPWMELMFIFSEKNPVYCLLNTIKI